MSHLIINGFYGDIFFLKLCRGVVYEPTLIFALFFSSDVYTYTFDHVYPSSDNNPVTALLYGELGTEIFGVFHEKLEELARAGKIRYLLRHYVQVSGLNQAITLK